MTCHDLERMLMLEQSGELPRRRRTVLTAHLAACAACRARRDDFYPMARFLNAVTSANGPSESVIASIITAAHTNRPARYPRISHLTWGRALAAAAALAVLLGFLGLAILRPVKGNVPVAGATRLAEVSSLLAMLLEHDADATTAHAAAASGDLRAFARQLLILEGLADDVFEQPADDATRLEERQPTTLQWRSTPGVPS